MRKAFTLIELLVVIAIIAILAAILFPVFAQAKEAAKKTSCLSSTKQMAIGIYIYTTDSDDTMCQTSWEQDGPGTQSYNPANPAGAYQVHWTFLIQPYIKNWKIFVCPSDPNPTPTDAPCPNGQSDVGNLVNGQMTCDWAAQVNSYIPVYNVMPAHDWTVVSLGQLDSPAQQIMVTEHRNDQVASDGHKGTSGFFPSQPCPNWALVPYPAGSGQYSYFPASVAQAEYAAASPNFAANKNIFKKYDIVRVAWDRHSGQQNANYCFADGHAKNQNVGQTLNPNAYEYGTRWYPNSQPWNTSPCQ
ncbi:MAG: prepilin-type N-terminal cleavage/methylation domain-containing protein [Fimbriimonas sp.]|nr:prepilin-type N-terminal cleavage/methylation domain-containing protein [Fimbriimonas sp.]